MIKLLIAAAVLYGAHLGLAKLYSTEDADLASSYEEGRLAGYRNGLSEGRQEGRDEAMTEIKRITSSLRSNTGGYNLSSGSTETCSSNGTTVNYNGKQYKGGKTGCVKVYYDGRVVRY
jgi:hypothetical protein